MFPKSFRIFIGVSIALLAGAILLLPRIEAPRLAQRVTGEEIHAAIQREADTTFVVTGYLDVVGAVRSEDSRVILPNLLNWTLGTTRATVRVPGRVSYGFDIAQLTPAMIRVRGDTVDVEMPLVAIYSAEPDLSRLEVETNTGWARRPVTAQEAERRAVQLLTEALRRQGTAHLADSMQPQVNTARALQRIIRPVAVGLGIEDPKFRIHFGEGLLLTP